MTALGDHRSIVGLDPTDRGLAFVFFEEGKPLDWGTRRDDGNELAIVDRILDGCAADVLVIEDADAPQCRRRERVRKLLRTIERHAHRRGVAVLKVAREEVRQSWARDGVRNKQGAAEAIAARFKDMEIVLPRPRKVYRSDDARAQIFDAASLVVYACGSRANP
jgi:hypothetical protein